MRKAPDVQSAELEQHKMCTNCNATCDSGSSVTVWLKLANAKQCVHRRSKLAPLPATRQGSQQPIPTLGLPQSFSPTPPKPKEQVESTWTRATNALFGVVGSGYPTLAQLQAELSSNGKSSTPTLATTTGFANTPPSNDNRGFNATAASAQTATPTGGSDWPSHTHRLA
eukprot:2152997-Amphidinium_carterae.2